MNISEIAGKKVKAFIPDVEWLQDYGIEEVLDRLDTDYSAGLIMFEDGTAIFVDEVSSAGKQDVTRFLKEYRDFIDGYSGKLKKIVDLASVIDTINKVAPAVKTKPVAKKVSKRLVAN